MAKEKKTVAKPKRSLRKLPLSKIKEDEVLLKDDGPHSLLHDVDLDGKESMKDKDKKTPKKPKKASNPMMVMVSMVLIVVSGTITGFGLSKVTSSSGSGNNSGGGGKVTEKQTGVEQGTGIVADGNIKKGDLLGDQNKNGDEAEGVLQKGGINGEGSHRLLRDGGPSRNVYLTSSVVDLDQLVGHKVKVWGETFSAQSAGWLMDVVTVEVVALDEPLPFEEE